MNTKMITDKGTDRTDRLDGFARNLDALQRDVASFGDPADNAGGAGAQSLAVVTRPERRHHDLAAGFSREPVGDPLLEAVADLDPDLPLLEREQDQQAVVLALLADAAAVVLEQLDGVFADVAVAADGRHGGNDHDVAAGGLERAAQRIDGARTVGIDDVGEIVDRLGQCGKRRGLSRCRPAEAGR